jgi:hypothetical protein
VLSSQRLPLLGFNFWLCSDACVDSELDLLPQSGGDHYAGAW